MTYGILAALVGGLLVVMLGFWLWAIAHVLRRVLFDARRPERPPAERRRRRAGLDRCIDCNRIVWPAWACCPACGANLEGLG